MHKGNVWIFNHYATNSFYNKGGRHYWFADNLKKNGYSPVIFCANTRHNNTDYIEVERKNKFTIKSLDSIPYVFVKTTHSIGNGIDRIKNMIIFFLNLFRVAKKYSQMHGKPDFIIASSVHPLTLVAGIQIAKKLNVPCICEIRDLWPEAIFAFGKVKEGSILGKALVSGEYWIYKNADALIFTKEGDTDYIKEKKWDLEQGGKVDLNKCYYINNGVDLESYEENVTLGRFEDKDLNSEKFNVIYVGSIRPVNNVGNILDAASLLKEEEDIQFIIYGDGSERTLLEKRVSNENLSNVKIKGNVKKQFIPYILSKSSVNILNYSQTQYIWKRGNSSNKLFEYMASGRPIISTVKIGYSIINKYNCGVEIENATGTELADAILKIKNMPKSQYEEMSNNAETGAREFDFKVLTNKLLKVLNKLS